MADKKAPGRPKRAEAPKRVEAPKKFKLDAETENDQENGRTSDKEAPKAEKAKSQEKVGQEISSEISDKDVEIEKLKAQLKKAEKSDKVIDVTVTTEAGKKPKLTGIRRPNKLHEVFVKGVSRLMTRQSYEAVAKDPKLDVSIPKGSTLVEPNIQPCVDC